jgi:hypothetical protein
MMKKIYFNRKKAADGLFRNVCSSKWNGRRRNFNLCILPALILLIMAVSCAEVPFIQTPTDSVPPAPLTNVRAESLPGGGKIRYDIPNESDISYVKGEFIFQGKKRIIRSSAYNNYLIVDGLGSVDPVEITLSVVDHSENVSIPVTASFVPDTPPIETIFESLQMAPDFAGVHVTWENPLGLEIGITLLYEDSLGIMKEGPVQFSILRNGSHTFRGTEYYFDTVPRKFAISIFDKWNNASERFENILTPFYEKLLDRTKHIREVIPLDNLTAYSSGTQMDKMFDGITTSGSNFYHTQEGIASITMPFYFSMTLGVDAILSRFVVYHRVTGNWEYSLHNVKEFEVWGADTYRQQMPDEYWDQTWKADWKYIGKFICDKPSGNNTSEITAEDREYAFKGFEFPVPLEIGHVRYLRFAINSTWGNTNASSIQEMQFYGNDNI